MHVKHKGNHEKLSGHKKIAIFLIRQLFWIIFSDEVLRLCLETTFGSLGLEGFRSHLALKGYRS